MGRASYFIATAAVTALAVVAVAAPFAFAADKPSANAPKEQYFPIITFKTGAAAPLGIATFYGYVDYWEMLNKRDGGVNGVKIIWDECESERKVDKGVECY